MLDRWSVGGIATGLIALIGWVLRTERTGANLRNSITQCEDRQHAHEEACSKQSALVKERLDGLQSYLEQRDRESAAYRENVLQSLGRLDTKVEVLKARLDVRRKTSA